MSSVVKWIQLLTDDLPSTIAGNPYQPSMPYSPDESVTIFLASLHHCPYILGVFDFSFMGGSMGVLSGERIAQAFFTARQKQLPIVWVCASGGVRMQDGSPALMQMAKTLLAVETFKESGHIFISILTEPVLGGVMASFATQAHVIIGENNCRAGFAGPRVVSACGLEPIPLSIQSTNQLYDKGLIDILCEKSQMTDIVSTLLQWTHSKE